MKKFKCDLHSIIVNIPYTNNEFYLGKYHDDVEICFNHHKQFPSCKFQEVQEV